MSCGHRETSNARNMELIPTTDSAEETIAFKVDVDDGDFKMIEQGDSTLYVKQLYEGLDGRNVQFDERLIRNIDVRMKIEFSVLQYTIDDSPAYPLAFCYESNWCDLTAKNGIIQIPIFITAVTQKRYLKY